MKKGFTSYLQLFKTISSLISIQASSTQAMILFDFFIRDITELFNGDYAFIQLNYQREGDQEINLSRAYGLPEEQCLYINNYAKANILPSNQDFHVENRYVYHFGKLISNDLYPNEPIRTSGVKTIISVPILSTNPEYDSLSIYFTSDIEIGTDQLEFLFTLGELLANAYIYRLSYQQQLDKEAVRNDYFWKSYESLLVLDETLTILESNETGRELLGSQAFAKARITEYIEKEDIALVVSAVQNLNEGDLSKIIPVTWMYSITPDQDPEIVKINFGFTKIRNSDGLIRIIASGRVQHVKEAITMRTTLTTSGDIISKLADFKDLFERDSESAAKIAKDEFFPAAFALIVNEETGPMPLVSAPQTDHYKIMEETIRLMAGLNTDQIVSQYYITGSSPWSAPIGEFRWIAFSKQNPKARGKLEFHLIGIVIEQNLLTVLPKMVQILLGILLGGMNTYLGILNDDNADFTTQKFDGDRNFSTITIIQEALDELRTISTEILGATLTGSDIL
ncbi:MAG: hypothetical protein ACXAD7_01155 [Candidatus Kariarchaeaceae archaeon]|jgi:hypothetical protein